MAFTQSAFSHFALPFKVSSSKSKVSSAAGVTSLSFTALIELLAMNAGNLENLFSLSAREEVIS